MKTYLTLIYQKNKKITIPILIMVIVAMVVGLFYIEYSNVSSDTLEIIKETMPELGIQFFYIIQDAGLSLIFFVLMLVLLPNLISSNFLEMSNSKFNNMITTRIGYSQRIKNELKTTFIFSFMFTIFADIIILITIHLFCFSIHFTKVLPFEGIYDLSIIFSNNQLLSLIIYVLLSACGYGVFSCFVYSLQFVIKNIYLYRALGLFIGISLVILPSFISQLLNINILSTIVYFLSIWAITSPGIGSTLQASPTILYIGSICIYSLIIVILLKIKEKKEKYSND